MILSVRLPTTFCSSEPLFLFLFWLALRHRSKLFLCFCFFHHPPTKEGRAEISPLLALIGLRELSRSSDYVQERHIVKRRRHANRSITSDLNVQTLAKTGAEWFTDIVGKIEIESRGGRHPIARKKSLGQIVLQECLTRAIVNFVNVQCLTGSTSQVTRNLMSSLMYPSSVSQTPYPVNRRLVIE